jgi:probable HAF family extracellular repeat protein
MRTNRLLPAALATCLLISMGGIAWSDPTYTITDLGTLGGSASSAAAVNDAGQVVGDAFINNNLAAHAFMYNGSSMQDLGTLSGDSHGLAVNSLGQAVGYSTNSSGNDHATLYVGGAVQDLGTLGGLSSHGFGINTAGTIVGDSDVLGATPADNTTHAFVYSAGTMMDIGTLAGPGGGAYSGATAINELGHVVGYSAVNAVNDHAFLYTTAGGMKDLGTIMGTSNSEAFAINSKDQIVGTSENTGSPSHAFLYSNGAMQDIGTLGNDASAEGINDLGQVVGNSYLMDGVTQHAFLYDSAGIHDLNTLIDTTSGWELQDAAGINNVGDIVGSGFINGDQHAFLLTPANPIPEPASVAMLGLLSIGLIRRPQKT